MDHPLNAPQGPALVQGVADVNGTNLWYEIVGAGECVVQIGGAVSAHEGYDTVTPHLARHFEVLNYDHRGYGLSARPKQTYTSDVWCDDLASLLDYLGKARVHIHGGSMGSFVAIAFALAHPERVDKLLLGAGAVAKCDGMGVAHFRVWQHLARAFGVGSQQLADELVNKAFSRDYIDRIGLDTLVEGMVDSASRNADTAVFIDACQVMIDADVGDALPNLTAPTLVMVGAHDVLTPLDTGPNGVGARRVAELIPTATLKVFEGSGHGHYIEQPDESIDAILEFLR
ncbi:MAG: alpha/beta hydrolase [Ilumatobacteraceae bacterium]